MARYKRNYITEAILRIDFVKPISSFINTIPEELDRLILSLFPNKESKNAFSEELVISPNSDIVERKRIEFKEWNYYGNEKNKRFCITKDFFFITYKQYISYEDFTESIIKILKTIAQSQEEFSSKRIGMRYINNIKLTDNSPLDWNDYINENMIKTFELNLEGSSIIRAFHNFELVSGDIKTKFQFGMHNPDYPSPIKQKIFVLDFDTFKIGNLSGEDIESLIPELHGIIETLFENSITENLRNILNE